MNSALLDMETLLLQAIDQMQSTNDIRGSIPLLAKLVHVVESRPCPDSADACSQREWQKKRADAYARLADAHYKIGQYVQGDASLDQSITCWERMIKSDPSVGPLLIKAYDQMIDSCNVNGKEQLASHFETRRSKLEERLKSDH